MHQVAGAGGRRENGQGEPERRSPTAGRRLAALGTLLITVAVVASGCDWLQFRMGPDHSGFNSGESAISVANVGTLVQRVSAASSA